MPALRNMILCAAAALITALPAAADTLPASVRACIGEADAGRRLTCYDREVARLIAPPDTFMPAAAAAAAAAAPQAPPMPVTSASLSAPPPSAPPPPAAPRHLVAKVSIVHQAGDNLVVTLDNGDVWEQAAPATSQLNLQPGDVVHVDHEMATWFLSNRYGDSVQVKLRQPK
jgi:hypothetical protein